MRNLIDKVLLKYKDANLSSAAGRQTIANAVITEMRKKDKSFFLDLGTIDGKAKLTPEELEEQRYKEYWTCTICGKDTSGVDYDYIGTGTNHLGCELKNITHNKNDLELEMKDNKRVTKDRRKGDRRENRGDDVAKALGHMDEDGEFITESRREQIKSRGVIRPKKRVKKKFYEDMGDGHMLEVGKLSEEIVDKQEGKWVYESPDGGETVFRRPFFDYDPKNKEEIDFKTKEPTGRMFTDYPFKDKRDVQIDGC